MPGVDQNVADIFDRTSLQYVLKKHLDAVNLLYDVLSSTQKSNISANNMLCDLISSMKDGNARRILDLAALIVDNPDPDWSTQARSPYNDALCYPKKKLDL